MTNYNWLKTKPIAHRGLFDNNGIAENSIVAFQKAVENGFAIELDVQMTKDGVLVVFHDDDLERMTGLKGDIREKTFREIRDLKLLDTDSKIPTFSEMLKAVDGKTPLLIEIKTHKKIGSVEKKALEEIASYNGEYVFESFNPLIVRWFKRHAKSEICGQLADRFDHKVFKMPRWQLWFLSNLKFCKWNGAKFIAYNVENVRDNKAIEKWRKKVPLLSWTIRSEKQLEETKHLYDNFIFDSFLPSKDNMEVVNK